MILSERFSRCDSFLVTLCLRLPICDSLLRDDDRCGDEAERQLEVRELILALTISACVLKQRVFYLAD